MQVVTEKVWDYCTEYDLPRAIVINWMDRELADFGRALESVQQAFGRGVVPLQLPIGAEKKFRGVIDLVTMKALLYTPDGDGRAKVEEIPAELAAAAKEAHEKLVEMVAEGDDKLMEEFFEKGTLPVEDLMRGLRAAFQERRIFPVMVGSALHNIGSDAILNLLVDVFPDPAARGSVQRHERGGREGPASRAEDRRRRAAFDFRVQDVFRSLRRPHQLLQGDVRRAAQRRHRRRTSRAASPERFQHTQAMQGKSGAEVAELHAGDIGAIAKLKETLTGDTLGDKARAHLLSRRRAFPSRPSPLPSSPRPAPTKTASAQGIHKILEEDLALRFSRDPQTKEFLLSGSGQQHIEVVVAKLRKRFQVDLTLKPPKVPYRETIRAKADAEGKHKKQTGGHGQFGVCRVRFEPLPRGAGFEFVDDIFGGAIPKNWIPSVEKGIRASAERGYLAGFPMVDFRAVLYDGKYHDVDSSDMAFKIAGSLAFKEGMKQARPTLLEPVMHVEVYAPDQYSGDIMGDLSSRRGRISGSEARGANVVVKAQVPFAEMLSYATDLTSMTQGRASYSMEFSHYDFVPNEIAEKVIAQAKAGREGGDRGRGSGLRRWQARRSTAGRLLPIFALSPAG